MISCFENIVGLSRGGCQCTDGDLDSDVKKSTSDMYIDELPECSEILRILKQSRKCDDTMAKRFKTALKTAIDNFQVQLFMELGSRFQARGKAYKGPIGKKNGAAPFNTPAPFIGQAMEMRPYSGAVLNISGFTIYATDTVPLTKVELAKAYKVQGHYQVQEILHTWEDVTTNTRKDVSAQKISLPAVDNSDHIVHYILGTDHTGWQPLNNTNSCCGEYELISSWMIPGGISGQSLDDLPTSAKKIGKTAPAYGFVIDAELKCDDTNFICNNYEANSFLRIAVDHAIWNETGSIMLNTLLHSKDITPFLMTGREDSGRDLVILHNRFKNRVEWIAQEMDLTTSNCYVCNTTNSSFPYKTSIRL